MEKTEGGLLYFLDWTKVRLKKIEKRYKNNNQFFHHDIREFGFKSEASLESEKIDRISMQSINFGKDANSVPSHYPDLPDVHLRQVR